MAVFGGFVYAVLLMVFGSIYGGYALTILWKWFVVPIFHTPELSIPSAIGIALVVNYLTKHTSDCKKEEKSFSTRMVEGTVEVLLKPSFAILMGWVVQKYM